VLSLVEASKLALHSSTRYFFRQRGYRPAVLQKIIDMRKRLRDPPTSGQVSIVVTDIEDFSSKLLSRNGRYAQLQHSHIPDLTMFPDLMKASPELMMPALITHNNLMLRAKAQNFGHTCEQVGVKH
jgi:hypothetical protein